MFLFFIYIFCSFSLEENRTKRSVIFRKRTKNKNIWIDTWRAWQVKRASHECTRMSIKRILSIKKVTKE